MTKQIFKVPIKLEQVDEGSFDDRLLVRTNGGDIKELSFESLPTNSTPLYLGNLINDNFNRSSLGSDYTVTGTANWTIIDNKLRVSGGGSSSTLINNCFNTAKLTNSENYVAKMKFNFYQITASDFGLSLMVQSVAATFKYSFYMALNISTGVDRGKLNVWSSNTNNGSTISLVNTTTRALTISVGDEIEYTIYRNGVKYLFEARNNNTNDTVSYYLDSSLSAGYAVNKIVNNVCKFGFSKQDGASSTAIYDITYFNVDRDLIKNRKFLFIGDSITFGYESGGINNRWPDLVFSNYGLCDKHIVYAQPGNVSNDYNINLKEIAEFDSKYAVVMLGMNDAQTNVPLSTFQANYSSLVSNLVAQNKIPILCFVIPHSNATYDALIMSYNAWIKSTYSSQYLIIDTYNPLKALSYTGPHPPADGHKILSMVVYEKIKSFI